MVPRFLTRVVFLSFTRIALTCLENHSGASLENCTDVLLNTCTIQKRNDVCHMLVDQHIHSMNTGPFATRSFYPSYLGCCHSGTRPSNNPMGMGYPSSASQFHLPFLEITNASFSRHLPKRRTPDVKCRLVNCPVAYGRKTMH